MNRHVEDTRDQILNTLQILSGCGLTRITKDVLSTFDQDCEILTWNNHVSGRHNAGKSFTTLNQYISIYETGAYHSIIDVTPDEVYLYGIDYWKDALKYSEMLIYVNVAIQSGLKSVIEDHPSDTCSRSSVDEVQRYSI